MPGAAEYLQTPLQYLKGVGPRRAAEFKRANLHTIEDLLFRFPFRYEDRARFAAIADLKPGVPSTISGEVVTTSVRPTRRPNFRIFEMLVRDDTGVVKAVFFNQPFLRDVFHPHQQVVLYGKVELFGTRGLQVVNPTYEILQQEAEGDETAPPDEETIHTRRIVPIYERIGSLTAKQQRSLVYRALQKLPTGVPDLLPAEVLARRGLPSRERALRAVHFPEPDDGSGGDPIARLNAFRTPAQVAIIFEEYFLFQVGVLLRRKDRAAEHKARPVAINDAIRESVRQVLPFKLTAGQRKAIQEIVADMERPAPMNRLLQGDVGSGKTIVALMAAVVAMENGLQVAFMAPTEILADQHYITIRRLLERSRFRVGSLTGSTPAKHRREVMAELASGSLPMVVGTHALVEGAVTFRELGLAIIDEQHRFGVEQRAELRRKGLSPDVLVMTATPIPRTLAITMYGELETSVIRDMPPGRKPIKTAVKPESRRDEVYEFVRQEVEKGRQAYIIYPIIEESEKIDLKAATAMADHLASEIFPELRVTLLHGRMKQDVKDRVMNGFARGEYDILVATTVVEVGVDVPNATAMVVEHAERFGLSQLHQLRGRVGRRGYQSSCILLYQHPLTEDADQRLRAIASTTDGFALAEKDLELRGPGDYFGTRQSGVPLLRVGDLNRDAPIMDDARREAAALLASGTAAQPVVDYVRSTWERRFGLASVG
ncbi:MAG TPA: ATP-dependent DNA helicase RecG [Vicinamibacterales bacterium]|nr:ATP-dependent DNA helicase RecG [Vicinamibacterales bacterium]